MTSRARDRKTNARGAFLKGVWHCNCDPRLPASHFQTKNGKVNHGRWFYTCQKSQPKRCDFFLWADNAKVREESAVLNNSRSEPVPQTPRKSAMAPAEPITPYSRERPPAMNVDRAVFKPPVPSSAPADNDDSFDWPSSNDEDLAEAATLVAAAPLIGTPPLLETPRKQAKTMQIYSPGKRSRAEMEGDSWSTWPPPNSKDDVFSTPRSSNRNLGLLSPIDTPSQGRSQAADARLASSDSSLVSSALKLLAPVNLSSAVEVQLVDLLNKHDLRTQGIAKGRDISRLAIEAKDKKIAELQARIAGLEAERETSKAVISFLKQDIASSPSKRGRGTRFGRRTERQSSLH